MCEGIKVRVNGRPAIYYGKKNAQGQCLVVWNEGGTPGNEEAVDCGSMERTDTLAIGQRVFYAQPMELVKAHDDGTYSAIFSARFHADDLRAFPELPGDSEQTRPAAIAKRKAPKRKSKRAGRATGPKKKARKRKSSN
jgi:hypothetical protein